MRYRTFVGGFPSDFEVPSILILCGVTAIHKFEQIIGTVYTIKSSGGTFP